MCTIENVVAKEEGGEKEEGTGRVISEGEETRGGVDKRKRKNKMWRRCEEDETLREKGRRKLKEQEWEKKKESEVGGKDDWRGVQKKKQ